MFLRTDFATMQKGEPMEWIVEAESLSDFVDRGRYTIHAKPLVRCRDCEHHHRDNSGAYYCGRKEYGYGWGLNDFCSDAERRTDESD